MKKNNVLASIIVPIVVFGIVALVHYFMNEKVSWGIILFLLICSIPVLRGGAFGLLQPANPNDPPDNTHSESDYSEEYQERKMAKIKKNTDNWFNGKFNPISNITN